MVSLQQSSLVSDFIQAKGKKSMKIWEARCVLRQHGNKEDLVKTALCATRPLAKHVAAKMWQAMFLEHFSGLDKSQWPKEISAAQSEGFLDFTETLADARFPKATITEISGTMKIWIASYRDKVLRTPQSEQEKTVACVTQNLASRECIRLLEENFILGKPHFLGEDFGHKYEDLFSRHDYSAMVALYQKMVPWGPTLLIEEVELVES